MCLFRSYRLFLLALGLCSVPASAGAQAWVQRPQNPNAAAPYHQTTGPTYPSTEPYYNPYNQPTYHSSPSYQNPPAYPNQPTYQYPQTYPNQPLYQNPAPYLPLADASGDYYRMASDSPSFRDGTYAPTQPPSQPLTWAAHQAPGPGEDPKAFEPLPPVKGEYCEMGCATCLPAWQVTAELIGLRRQPANDHLFVKECGCDNPQMDVGDLSFGYELGVRVSIARSDCCYGGWEFGYLGLPEWDASQTASGNLYFQGLGFSLQACPGLFLAEYDSSLHSFEINYRPMNHMDCFSSRCSFFGGFRYIRLDETFRLSELNAPIYSLFKISTANNLYGVHFGNSYLLYDCGGPLYVETLLKFGIYANESSQHTMSSVIGPPAGASRTTLAYSGEFAIAAGYRITHCVDIRAGYQLLGIGAVALAPDQLVATDLIAHTASVQYNTLIAHGGFIGLTVRW
ncbi:MAG: hypothetical protein KJ000_16955 [Pirellulaceae bacterium]|nr:hypothetical protein [Pirellulaceae bacterium]